MKRAVFRSKRRFERESLPEAAAEGGVLLHERDFSVCARPLDHHGLASLAFAFEEGVHINVWKNRLDELGLPTGPWLTELKEKVRSGAADETPIAVRWRTREGSREQVYELGALKERVLEFEPGQRVCYVTDVAGHEDNARALVEFLKGADLVFIETVFLDQDRDHAERKAHLTAKRAGDIVRAAGVKTVIPFHFSTRYLGREEELRREFEESWRRH